MNKMPDKTDREIIAQLRLDVHVTNQQIAEALGLNAATVASRIKRLEDNNLLRVVAVSDFAAYGYKCLIRVAIKAENRPLADIAHDLARLPGTLAVHIVSGGYDLDALLGLGDASTVAEQLRNGISAIPGIRYYTPSVVLDIVKYHFDVAPISPRTPMRDRRKRQHDPSLPVDELDLALIDTLSHDARVANAAVAKELGVTEGTVRSRIKRLKQRNLMTFVALTSPETTDKAQLAFLWLETEPAACASTAQTLAAIPSCSAVLVLTGRTNILAVCREKRMQDVFELASSTILPLQGVRSVETEIVVESVMHNTRMANLQA